MMEANAIDVGKALGTDYFLLRSDLTAGTETIQTLIVGRDITGVSAFT
jgi:hypothetical protein